jgi:hypothetical protein
LGGVSAIAVSHPHYYATMVEWARAFSALIFVHAADPSGSPGSTPPSRSGTATRARTPPG